MLEKLDSVNKMDSSVVLSGNSCVCEAARKKILQGIQDAIPARFHDLSDSILKATQIAELKEWPEKGKHIGWNQTYTYNLQHITNGCYCCVYPCFRTIYFRLWR